jgi:hypothetical protein
MPWHPIFYDVTELKLKNMKTAILIISIMGLGFMGNAQTANCVCKKTTQHKMVYHHHRAKRAKAFAYNRIETKNIETAKCAPQPEPCYVYKKDNILVMQCPGVFYNEDGKGVFEYGSDGAYLGYYPVNNDSKGNCVNSTPQTGKPYVNMNQQIAPQHTVIDNHKGVAPEGANYCVNCTSE